MNKIEYNFIELNNLKSKLATEIVYLLELFGGKLSLTDILQTELPLLAAMRDAKIQLTNDIREQK